MRFKSGINFYRKLIKSGLVKAQPPHEACGCWLEIDTQKRDSLNRRDAVIANVLARLGPDFSTSRSCIAIFGTGEEPSNAAAVKKWLTQVISPDALGVDVDLHEVAKYAFKEILAYLDQNGFDVYNN